MVNVDRRLIFSGVKDFTDGLDTWFDTYHTVHISSAGSGYLEAVATNPAYLQWALLEPKQLFQRLGGESLMPKLTSGMGRLEVVLDGLVILREDELLGAEKLKRREYLDVNRSLSPIGWIFFGSVQRFIIDISGFKSAKTTEAAEIAGRFIEFGKKLRQEHEEVFGGVPV